VTSAKAYKIRLPGGLPSRTRNPGFLELADTSGAAREHRYGSVDSPHSEPARRDYLSAVLLLLTAALLSFVALRNAVTSSGLRSFPAVARAYRAPNDMTGIRDKRACSLVRMLTAS
jgi:hypothetical protein